MIEYETHFNTLVFILKNQNNNKSIHQISW